MEKRRQELYFKIDKTIKDIQKRFNEPRKIKLVFQVVNVSFEKGRNQEHFFFLSSDGTILALLQTG